MKKKLIQYVCICIIFFSSVTTIFPVASYPNLTKEDIQIYKNIYSDGWIEIRDNVTILHVKGSHYEMGYQHGILLKEKIQQNIRAMLHYAERETTYEELMSMWNTMKKYVDQKYIDELTGIADGANISFLDLAAAIMVVVWGDSGCYGISSWGPATKNGTLYHARSFDLPMTIQDPQTGVFAYENAVLIIREPNEGYASISPTVAGSFHTGGGINEQGISLGIQVCWSKDQTLEGIPYHFRIQEILDHAQTIEEAITIINTNRTRGYNIIISDCKQPVAYVVEQSANNTYIGTFNDSIESNPPFWSINHVVRRTNCFIDPVLAATQRKRYDPTGLIGFLNLLFHTRTNNPFFAIYRLYTTVSNEINDNWGNLDLQSLMNALREGYRAKDDVLLRIFKLLGKGTGLAEAWNQWVACPQTGDIIVSFADKDNKAFDTPIHVFNFYDLLTTTPPQK